MESIINSIKNIDLDVCNVCSKDLVYIKKILDDNSSLTEKFITKSKIVENKFPPRLNQNKFIYGKLVEHLVQDTFSLLFNSKLLDENEYKNDIRLDINKRSLNFSIKTTKVKSSNIRLINKYSDNTIHKFDNINMIVVNLNRMSIFIFNTSWFDQSVFNIKNDGIDLKSKFYKILEDNFPESIFKLEQKKDLDGIKEFDLYKFLLKDIDNSYNELAKKN